MSPDKEDEEFSVLGKGVDSAICNGLLLEPVVMRRSNAHGLDVSLRLPNDIEFSGERKRVRCNEGLDGVLPCREPGRVDTEERAWACYETLRSGLVVLSGASDARRG
jgi:hypothetical protein